MADELQKTNHNSLVSSRPAFLPDSAEGTEHITQQDLRVPRLSIAQGLSDQIKPNHAKYIDGLKLGQLFNDVTGQIYGAGPLEFFIVRADPPRYVEFRDRKEGGGIIDLNVPPSDPRTQFTTNEKGEREKPRAMMFYDYVICLWPSREVIALSLKSSGIKHAKALNGLIKLRNAPVWSGKYTVEVKEEPSPNGPFPNYAIRNAGTQTNPLAGWVANEEDAAYLKQLFNTLKDKNLVIEREPGDDNDIAAGQSTNNQPVGESIPF